MASNTLLIKHLPSNLTDDEKEKLLMHFGAKEVKCITSKINKYNVAFARFENETIAENILHRLHQLQVLGSYLSVEYAHGEKVNTTETKISSKDLLKEEAEENEKIYKKFVDRLNSWQSGVDFTQPVPSHLKYQYPPPDSQILLNIAKGLANVPKFYTQVLHLMNKMNLPCPFGRDILPDFHLEFFQINKVNQSVPLKPSIPEDMEIGVQEGQGSESSESEISTDEEAKKNKETIPDVKRIRKKKSIKVPKFVKPVAIQPKVNQKRTKVEEVFEKICDEKDSKRIKLSYPPRDVLEEQKQIPSFSEAPLSAAVILEDTENKSVETAGFGFIRPVTKPVEEERPVDLRDEREEERLEKEEIISITSKALAENRLSEKDRSVLPVYKNYAEGAPTCRLYIKNLAKAVTEEDLRFIYSRYLSRSIEDSPNMFDIRLMQEGRMKGQAFVTLQTVELAHKALKETNGYILKDKPLVVQFARSATK